MDHPVSALMGLDGLTNLLKIQHYDKLPAAEVSMIIRRLQIPGYEQARPFFADAIAEEIIERPSTPGFFMLEDIRRVREHYSV